MDPTRQQMTDETAPPVVLFDGVCNLCNGTVNFIIDRDRARHFRFAALQSDAAKPFLECCDLATDFLAGIVLYENGRCFTRSTAALRILRRLGGPWRLLYGLVVVPRPLRDTVYEWVMRRRYEWFGRAATCRVPTPDVEDRFLDSAPTDAAAEESAVE
jgi:predicted DCC family thiol-disulfide oxidoreductase YuxK